MNIVINNKDKFANGLEIIPDMFLNVKNENKKYFTDFEDDAGEIITIFSEEPTQYVFRHTDCPLVFIVRDYVIFALDMDEQDVDPFTKYGFEQIEAVYNSYKEFTDTIEKIEKVLGFKLTLGTWDGTKEMYITQN